MSFTGSAPLGRLTALVVDDRESTRHVVASWLRRGGFDVVAAATGAEAIAAAVREPIDLAVLDVHLPDMSGFEVCEAIRANPTTETIAIVHLSATAVDSHHRSEGLLRGADAYLVEPVDPREFLAVVGALVRRSNLRRRTLRTTARLRSLNGATADVHAASTLERVYEALAAGSTRIAGAPTTVITGASPGATRWRFADGATTAQPFARRDLTDALAPAVAGGSTFEVEAGPVVPEPHVGLSFTDEFGEPLGAILVPATTAEDDDELLPILAQLALTATLALANLRALDIEHRIAVYLQDRLLPDIPPTVSGLSLTARDLAASQQARVGGDFYEVFALDESRIVIAIGDVVGHSLHAATVMAEIRHAMRAYALDGYDEYEVLERVERLVQRFHRGMYTSALYGVLDLDRRTYRFCNAGHPPALVVRSSGTSDFVTAPGAILGIGRGSSEPVVIDLGPGDRVLLITDGLIERRHESIDDGLDRLRDIAVERRTLPLDQLVDEIVARVGPSGAQVDDIAIVAFAVEPRPRAAT